MSKNFHRDYADAVGRFCQCVPPEAGVSCEEVDTYFRACALCLWAASGGRGGDVIGINQIYTHRQVKFSPQQFDKAIGYYRANPTYNVGVPEFFQRLAAWDAAHGTTYSRSFAEIQKNLLMLCAAYDGTFSFSESQRIGRLHDLLTAACDSVGVPPLPAGGTGAGPELTLGGRPKRDAAGELNDLMDEFDRVLSRDRSRSLYSDFFGGQPPARSPLDPLPVAEGPAPAEEKTPPAAPAAPEEDKGEEAPPRPSLEEAMAELNELVGLEVVKKDVESLVNLVKVRALRRERGMKCPDMSFHLVFSGNPGTGKTTIARLVARYLKAIGALRGGQLVEVSRGDLVGRYTGHTAPLTNSVIESALGGVLFIDKAYSLYRGEQDSFGLEAIDTLVKGMEDHREDLVVILAGYTREMEQFLTANSGLASRFPNQIEFPDYTAAELWQITQAQAKARGYLLAEGCEAPLTAYFARRQAEDAAKAGNGRLARNVLERAILNQGKRLIADPAADLALLLPDDFELD